MRKFQISAISGIFISVIPVFYELLLHLWISSSAAGFHVFTAIFFAFGLGTLLAALILLVPGHRARIWIAAAAALLLAVVFMTEFFINDAFRNFMAPGLVVAGAGGVANGFMDVIQNLLLRSWWRIALVLLPAVLLAVFIKADTASRRNALIFAALSVVSLCAAFGSLYRVDGSLNSLTVNYNFDQSIRSNGLTVSMFREFFGTNLTEQEITFVTAEIPVEENPTDTEASEATAEPVVRKTHTLDFDFEAMSKDTISGTYVSLCQYLNTVSPTAENEYTGMFAGKNLIFITAEALTAEVIDPVRTPTLYRLANQGIRFTDYYQPGWQGGTSSGELANLSGIVPSPASGMMEFTQQKPFFTIGRQLMNQGYFSRAYHNNDMAFYDRDMTHANLGYEQFIAFGNGMEEGVEPVWPESDWEMMDFTIPQYVDQQPFSIYYMTVSGHSVYAYDQNAQTRAHYEEVAELDHSEPVKCYLAANLELERAMTLLVEKLEEAGIADDTVIVISPDHFPYGLDSSSTWGNATNYISELFGLDGDYDNFSRDHNVLIIWSGCLEGKNITVDKPTCSLDILPTISNLFGVEFDSRLFVGHDVFSDAPALVLWPDFSWLTEKGRYYFPEKRFVPAEGVTVSDAYISAVSADVQNKINYSQIALATNFFSYLDKTRNDAG